MKLIGKGLFSKVYQLNDNQVLIKSIDLVKECLANFVDDENFPHLYRTDNENEYICKYYPKVTSLKNSLIPEHWEVYKELKKLYDDIIYPVNPYDRYSYLYDKFQSVSNESFRESLIDVLDELSNYDTRISFEISPRNVAVDNGKLILLDVFFLHNQMLEVRNSRSKKYNYI